ncbi:MAG: M6 family metalloprotease domain-containing protein [Candidatus Marinimicrobia bacterium]|nr:M6 family metalloprotease domain-containing protein [Candidatus Neomarinimicrobiota bacterium]
MKIFKNSIPIFASISIIFATWFNDIPRTITQPNGEVIDCFVTGDQYGKRLHDANDFTIIMNPDDGYYYYANLDFNGDLIPSALIVGHGNPDDYGLISGLAISDQLYQRNKSFYHNSESTRESRDAPTSGEIAQINVFIRFSDDPEFVQPRSYYDEVFQTDEDEPSLRHYYWEVSYNTLLVNTHHYPETSNDVNTSYQDLHPRSYYEPYSSINTNGYQNNDERTEREHTLLANALNSIASQVPPFINIDANDDGIVDAVSFVIYGGPGDWADLLWPHRWSLYTETVLINGAQVWDYLFMLSESWYFNVGVLCHEFFHVLGAPDLYHYDGGGAPSAVGGWDIMEANTNPPQYPSAFMKWKYGDWLPNLPEITESGTYTINPLQQRENAIYKIASPNSETEYFVVEYRRKEGLYDINTPGNRNGLVVYRINTSAGNGNAQGPPDEIYCYRPGGTLANNGSFDLAPYSSDYGHIFLNNGTDPSCFLYNSGNGGDGGLNLLNVTSADETISFTVSFGVPEIEVNPDELNFNVTSGDLGSQTVTLSNVGEAETQLNYSVNAAGDVPFSNPQGGPDGGNYYWTSAAEELGMEYEWIDIQNNATLLNFTHNDLFADNPVDLPFDFEFFNESYNYVEVNANGWIGWNSENENAWLNSDLPSPSAPRPAIFGFWDDLNPNNEGGNSNSSGDIYYHVNQERAVIWFNNVVRWNPDEWGQFDFQIVLYSNGAFATNYQNMDGVLNSGTIGFQNNDGSMGTQIVANEAFISSEFSWAAAQAEDENSWLILSGEAGDLSGVLFGGESTEIYVQVVTNGMNAGYYSANINVTAPDVESASIGVNLFVTGDNSTPILRNIDISSSENGIVNLPDDVDSLFSNVASRYTHIVAPNGDLIQFLIQDNFTVQQILHTRRVLESYLTDIPDTDWGSDKSNIAIAMAASNAIMFLLNDEDEYENPYIWDIFDSGVNGQDLLAIEVFPEGSSEYMNSTERDATYEEVLHFMHGYGVQLALPAMQNAIESAMLNAINNDVYNPLSDLPEDDFDEEYFAMGLECYFGLWTHDPNGDGFCGDQEYAFITREAMAIGDSALFAIINGYFGEAWEYTAVLPQGFNSNFFMKNQEGLDYTYRSQYLKNIETSGDQSINFYGNDFSNQIVGTNGNNTFIGYGGDDILIGGSGVDRAIYRGDYNYYAILPPFVTSDSSFQIIDLYPNRDDIDHLYEFEEIEFNGIVYLLSDLLDLNSDEQFPSKFSLDSPYPNPFNPSTSISYDIAKTGQIHLAVYDLNGRLIKTLKNGEAKRGYYSVIWDAKDENGAGVSTGIYFIKLTSLSFLNTHKILYLK